MGLIKTFISVAILSLGISGAVYIAKNYNLPASKTENNSLTALSEENNNLIQSHPFVENLPAQNGLETIQIKLDSSSLIGQFSQIITKALVDANPLGPEAVNGAPSIKTPDPEALTDSLLSETFKKFDLESFKPNVEDLIFKLIPGSDEKILIQYWNHIQNLFTKLGAKRPDGLTNIDQSIKFYQEFIDGLLNIEVPEPAEGFHKKLFSLISAKQNILKKMKEFPDDPATILILAKRSGEIDLELVQVLKELFNL